MDELNTYTEPVVEPERRSFAGPLAAGIGIFLVGVAIGGGAMWYRNRPIGVSPRPTPGASRSPQASVSPAASATPKPSTVTFRTVQATTKSESGRYMVVLDGKDAGVISWTSPDQGPAVIRAGSGWALVEVKPDGLGGYILYARYWSPWYVNASGKLVNLAQPATDFGFSADGRFAAYFIGGLGGNYLRIFDLQKGETTRDSVVVPDAPDAQPGLATFSPDGKKVAIAIGYGPENERGEIYVGAVMDLSSWTKVADTPLPPKELFWKADGTVGWR